MILAGLTLVMKMGKESMHAQKIHQVGSCGLASTMPFESHFQAPAFTSDSVVFDISPRFPSSVSLWSGSYESEPLC